MSLWRLIVPGLIAVLIVYYARSFILIRHEPSTIVQICLLLVVAVIALAPVPSAWKVRHQQVWMNGLVAAGLSVGVFVSPFESLSRHSSHYPATSVGQTVPATGSCKPHSAEMITVCSR